MFRLTSALAAALVVFSLSPAITTASPQSINKVNGAIRTNAGVEYGDLETVNGSIRVARGVRAADVETVNGSILIDDQARVDSVDAVNGSISIGAGVVVSGDVETVNGSVTLGQQTEVVGGIETVNGAVRLNATKLGKGIETVSGNIEVMSGSVVNGDIVVRKPSMGWFNKNQRAPRVTIGANSVVLGDLIFEREVELRVDPSAKIGKVRGSTVQTLEVERER